MSTDGSLRHTQHVSKSPAQRREELRFPESELLELTVLDASNHAFEGQTLDISETGLSFTAPVSIEEGKLVRIEVGSALVLAEVRYCRLIIDQPCEYAVGVSIEHVCFGWDNFYDRARGL